MNLVRADRGRNSSNATGVCRSEGQSISRLIQVAAGILCDDKRRVLIAERQGDALFSDLWEFPGGKIDAGETAEMALVRELKEEIGIATGSFTHFINSCHDYPERSVDIDFFLVASWSGEPRGLNGQKLQWVPVADLDEAVLLPADAPVVRELQKTILPD